MGSVVFDISSSHTDTILPNRHFIYKQVLVSNYFLFFRALLHSKLKVLGFHV